MTGIRSTRRPQEHAGPAAMLAIATLAANLLGCSDGMSSPSDPVVAASGGLSAAVSQHAIVVQSAAELAAALSPDNAGQRIHVLAGEYNLEALLTVPDGVTLEGEGTMAYNGAGLPAGFSGPRTTLRMVANIPGDMITLGDRVTIRNLEIMDLAGRTGNVVAVVSRQTGDKVSATITESEIINPNPAAGPAGHGLFVSTRNLNLGAPPAPHERASLTVRMVRSVIRGPAAGGGLFAFNYASHGKVSVTFADNRIGGVVTANGGVSLPDAVHDAETRIQSHRNLYVEDTANPCEFLRSAWNLTGGSGPPAPLPVPETARNHVRVHSVDDRIEGFRSGILATGSRRFFGSPIAGPSTDNSVDLTLLGTTISTPSCGGSPGFDLRLAGALVTDPTLVPGDGNTLVAVIRGVTGSGQRLNTYGDVLGLAGPQSPELQGIGNRLRIVGNLTAFNRTNRQIDPAPAAGHFYGGGN